MNEFYYYEENGKQLGPFTIDELKEKRLKKKTLVWKEGLEDWVDGDTLDDLNGIFISQPPSLQKKLKNNVINNKNDTAEERDIDASIIGILLFFSPMLLMLFYNPSNSSEREQLIASILLTSLVIIVRVLIMIWVYKISSRLNRNPFFWLIISFVFPTISLIIIGFLRKVEI